jgi:hypothetical protein
MLGAPASCDRRRGARCAAVLAAVAGLAACRSSSRPAMYPAGSEHDDGYGDLAQKSAQLLTSDGRDPPLPAARHRRFGGAEGDPYGGNPYGGAADDSDDATDATPASPPCGTFRRCSTGGVAATASPHMARYSAVAGLTGAVEGSVTWRGARPAALATACGPVAAAGVRIGADRGVGGVLVYIEHVELGRTMPSYGRSALVGGMIAKRGCALAPVVQIVTPLPAAVAIHGDATAAGLRITEPSGATSVELQAAGRVVLQAEPGVTRIEADDGSLGAAWVVAADTPYYAITDDGGRFRLDELAAGSYELTFWRPPLATVSDGKLVYGAPAITRRTVVIDAVRPARLDVVLDR